MPRGRPRKDSIKRFNHAGAVWQVIGRKGGSIYSPIGIDGTGIVTCQIVEGEMPEQYRGEATPGGCVDFCSDSVNLFMKHYPAQDSVKEEGNA